jgi:hypothetical protein
MPPWHVHDLVGLGELGQFGGHIADLLRRPHMPAALPVRSASWCGWHLSCARTPRWPCRTERLADALPAERAANRFIVSTDPDEHVTAISSYVDLGFIHLFFHAPGPGPGAVPARLRAGDPAGPA